MYLLFANSSCSARATADHYKNKSSSEILEASQTHYNSPIFGFRVSSDFLRKMAIEMYLLFANSSCSARATADHRSCESIDTMHHSPKTRIYFPQA